MASIDQSSSPYHALAGEPPVDQQPAKPPAAGKMGDREVVHIKKGNWDKTDEKLGTLGAYLRSAGKILVCAFVKVCSLVFRLKIIRSPLSTLSELAFGSNRQRLKDGYAEAVRVSFAGCEKYKTTPFPPDAGTKEETDSFHLALHKFSNDFNDIKHDPAKIRARIVELSKNPVYLKLIKTHPEHAAVKFIQDCGERLESANANDILSKYGRTRIAMHLPRSKPGDLTPHLVTHADLGRALSIGQKDADTTRDGPGNTLLWAADHLTELLHVEQAHLDPLGYDSYENQMVFIGEQLEYGDHTIIHKYTPGLTGPQSIVEHVLIPKYASERRRWVHIDNQSIHTADEKQRIDQVHKWSVDKPDTFLHAVLSTDTLDEVNIALIKRFKKGKISKEDFVEGYISALRGADNQFIREYAECRGIHIPDTLLSDDELDAAFTAAKNMSLNTPEGAFSVDVLRRNILSTFSWAIMKK